jgi:PAS domain S-box-containing protein
MSGALLIVVAIQAAVIVALLLRAMRRTRAERALRESEERFRLIADRAPVIMWTARPDTTLDYVNTTGVEFTGVPVERLLDLGWMEVAHPDDLDRCIRIYTPAFEARAPFLMELRLRGSDGAYRWFLDSAIPRYGVDGTFAGYIGCSFDITERKNAEDLIRQSQAALEVSHREVQQLAGRLIEAQDAERARIARDLHDDVSQQLAGLSIALSGAKRRMDELNVSAELQSDLWGLHERTIALAQNVRHLSHDLHPTVLRHAGLVAALTSHCAEVERSYGTASSCSAEGDFASIAPEVALCLYRIAQEALRNAIAHAGASRADVRLLSTGDHAELTIADDGIGFDVASSLKRGKGLGLVSITERVRLAGGTVSITAEVKKGTCVRVRIPANALVKSDTGSGAGDGRRERSLP